MLFQANTWLYLRSSIMAIDLITDSLLEDALEEAIAQAAEDGALEAGELLENFSDAIAEDPLLVGRLRDISL